MLSRRCAGASRGTCGAIPSTAAAWVVVMERFEVAGSTLVYWTMRVEAHDEREAAEEAQKIAGWVEIPSKLRGARNAPALRLRMPGDLLRQRRRLNGHHRA